MVFFHVDILKHIPVPKKIKELSSEGSFQISTDD